MNQHHHQETLLLQQPTVSNDQIAFVHAGDLWLVARSGGEARRLTAQKGAKSTPSFSPDGQWIAFSGNYDGNTSVYVISKDGGSPQRLTYHPGDDLVRGWTPDGHHILFATNRDTPAMKHHRVFQVSPNGGFPEALILPMADRLALSPDSKLVAYTRIPEPFWSWKRYRGGQAVPIWVLDLETYDYAEIPNEEANDAFPCWLSETVYFLSDRNHTMNLFAYDTRSQTVSQLTYHDDFDVRSLTAGHNILAYEQAGRVHLFDPATCQSQPIPIRVTADLPYTRPTHKRVDRYIRSVALSPTGQRALFEARGEIFTVPAKKGDIRNITATPGVHERSPAWSPDGQTIAYFSDANGEYELVLSNQTGREKQFITLGEKGFYYTPTWSPDSKKIAYTDKALNLYYYDLDKQVHVHVDTDNYDHPLRSLSPVWSPDSQWLAYSKRHDNHIRVITLYHVATAVTHSITDSMSDATTPCFSKDGKYLFFAASSNFGLNTGWLDMSSLERPIYSNLYVVVLDKETPSPLQPESDEELDNGENEPADTDEAEEKTETAVDSSKEKKKAETAPVKIDFDGLDQRILALPLPSRFYSALQTNEDKLFYLDALPNQGLDSDTTFAHTLRTYDLKERKSERFLDSVEDYWLSHNGKKLLYRSKGDQYTIVDTEKKPDPSNGKLNLSKMEAYVDPKAEWAQMYEDVYRIQRDFFYDAEMHGVDWAGVREKYRPFLPHLGHRSDLNFLIAEMIGELVVGHAYVGFGDIPARDYVPVGLLGADYEIVDGFYRIQRIYSGLNWYPELHAPLTQPGVQVSEGEYILAVNGRPLQAPTNIFTLFERTADRQTELTISATTRMEDGRPVTVVPIANDKGLRHWSWVEANRQKVNTATNGRVAYVYMPDTAVSGYASFNRYYFAQLDRAAVIIDERFNGGGLVADYVVDLLDRPLLSFWATREGKIFKTPNASIFGPKVMIINEYAGSGGDALPQFFRRRNLGKLVGKRTWGGLVGIYDYPSLMDGGFVSAPRLAIFSPEGEWEVENVGVYPDIEVEMEPKAVIAGRDPQLEKAIEVVLAELEANPVPKLKRPSPPKRAYTAS